MIQNLRLFFAKADPNNKVKGKKKRERMFSQSSFLGSSVRVK